MTVKELAETLKVSYRQARRNSGAVFARAALRRSPTKAADVRRRYE